MENATKGLLIAAAVLIVILIISLALMILNPMQETGGHAQDLGDEISASTFNSKFTQYEGGRIRGSNVKDLINKVLTNNQRGGDTIALKKDNAAGADIADDKGIESSSYYKVEMTRDTNSGRITTIIISKL